MLSYAETKKVVTKANPAVGERMPEEFEWRIDLGGADLRGALLRGAFLGGADLSEAFLSRADLRGAVLSRAFLRGADLRGADLRGAFLRGADLSEAFLDKETRLNWQSHNLLSEILALHTGEDMDKKKLAGVVSIGWRFDWCWKDYLKMDDPAIPWALRVLGEYDKDNQPELLKKWLEKNPA